MVIIIVQINRILPDSPSKKYLKISYDVKFQKRGYRDIHTYDGEGVIATRWIVATLLRSYQPAYGTDAS